MNIGCSTISIQKYIVSNNKAHARNRANSSMLGKTIDKIVKVSDPTREEQDGLLPIDRYKTVETSSDL